jgi:hypothetical protein
MPGVVIRRSVTSAKIVGILWDKGTTGGKWPDTPVRHLIECVAVGVPGELLILGDFSHFAIMAVVSARRSGSVDSAVAESVLGEYPIYPATASFEAGDIKPRSGRYQAAAGV